jgi:Berberine and berberine like
VGGAIVGVAAPVGVGFQNFAGPELEDWAGAYYGPNCRRLVRVKAHYDPAGFLHVHQPLPVR